MQTVHQTKHPKRLIASALIATYLVIVFCWLFAPTFPLVRIVRPILAYIGFWQAYNVFAPDPNRINFKLAASVQCTDGSTFLSWYPNTTEKGTFDAVFQDRYRKFVDRVHLEKNLLLLRDFARFVARQAQCRPNSHPFRVILTKRWTETLPPSIWFKTHESPIEQTRPLFIYDVQAGDLN